MKLAACIGFSLMTVYILGGGTITCLHSILLAVQDNGKMNT